MARTTVAYDSIWFGLPGTFMAGCICGALIAAVGYAHFDPDGRHLERIARFDPAREEFRTYAAPPPTADSRLAARF